MKALIVKFIFLLLIILISLFSAFYFADKLSTSKDLIKEAKRNIYFINKKIFLIKDEIERLIIENKLATKIIFSGKEGDFLPFFDFLDDDYFLKEINYHISNPELMKIKYKDYFFQALYTKITMSFKYDSEAKLYMFLEDIKEKIPGYIRIKNMSIVKNNQLFSASIGLDIFTLKED